MVKLSDASARSAPRNCRCAAPLRARQHSRALSFESLEDRRLLSVVPALPANSQPHPTFEVDRLSTFDFNGSSTPVGLTPNEVRGAYGLGAYSSSGVLGNAITFHGIQGDGSGQTIAIVDEYDDPNALTDLNAFSAYYDLPQFNAAGGPTFQKLNQNGGTTAAGHGSWVHRAARGITPGRWKNRWTSSGPTSWPRWPTSISSKPRPRTDFTPRCHNGRQHARCECRFHELERLTNRLSSSDKD